MEADLQDGRREAVTARPLCADGDIVEGEGRGFVFGEDNAREAIFVIRWHGLLHGYRNECPHLGAPIDWPENRFFDKAGDKLMCATHGAVFRPEDGYCIAGPCARQSIERIEISVEDGRIFWLDGYG
jgi:nitrite reductase/ring-hydroxylating ferredoxin subunit